MRKVAALAAVVTISLGALTACSGNGGYCSALKDNSDAASIKAGDMSAAITKMKSVRDKAPSEQKAHWDTMIGYLEKSEAAKGDQAKMAELAGEAAKVGEASQAISKYAKDECKVDIKTGP
ncbi:hypothetical protein [Kribbella deserti]|uniref:Small secreted protein n=1 Tax=Kribbella deserti TaxID=1926257 RepID=A0ABV6QI93_9ACTN